MVELTIFLCIYLVGIFISGLWIGIILSRHCLWKKEIEYNNVDYQGYYFIEDKKMTADDFGEFKKGIWTPKKPTNYSD